VGWLIFLIGGEIAYFHQHPSAFIREATPGGKSHRFYEWLALSTLIEIARRHLSQAPPWKSTELAAQFGVSSLEELIDEFVKAGILLRSAEPPGVALAQPPEALSLKSILDLLNEPAASSTETGGPADHVLSRRDLAVQKALEGMTLRSLITEASPTVLKFPQSGGQSR